MCRPNPDLSRESAQYAADYLTHRHGKFHFLGGAKWVEEDLDKKAKFTYVQKGTDETEKFDVEEQLAEHLVVWIWLRVSARWSEDVWWARPHKRSGTSTRPTQMSNV